MKATYELSRSVAMICQVLSMHGVSEGDCGATLLAKVLVAAHCFAAAEWNETEAEDPSAQQDDYKAEKPLQSGLLVLDLGFASLSTCVALGLKWFHMPSWDTVRSHE